MRQNDETGQSHFINMCVTHNKWDINPASSSSYLKDKKKKKKYAFKLQQQSRAEIIHSISGMVDYCYYHFIPLSKKCYLSHMLNVTAAGLRVTALLIVLLAIWNEWTVALLDVEIVLWCSHIALSLFKKGLLAEWLNCDWVHLELPTPPVLI